MNIEDNQQLVRRFLTHFGRRAITDLLGAMSEDATWWIIGKPALFPAGGTKSRTDMKRIWEALFHHIDGGLEMKIIGMVAEGDKVAAEIRSHAKLTDGRLYENQYHMLFTFRQGKVAEVREYADTLLIASMFT